MSGRPGPSGRSASSPTGGPSTPPEATSPSCPAISPEGPTDSRCAGARPLSLEQQRHRGLVHRQAPPNAGARPRTGLHSRPTPTLRKLTEAEMATTTPFFFCLFVVVRASFETGGLRPLHFLYSCTEPIIANLCALH